MEKNNLSEHINKTVKQLEKYLHELSEDHIKKAELISYWLRKYIYYLKQEETFIPSRNPEYKYKVRRAAIQAIKEELDKNSIEIPYMQIDVHNKS